MRRDQVVTHRHESRGPAYRGPMEGLLQGRTTIITGGGGGIGAAMSTLFGEHGASRSRSSTSTRSEPGQLPGASPRRGANALAVVADVREPDGVERAVADTTAVFGAPRVLVNNVGHYVSFGKPFHDHRGPLAGAARGQPAARVPHDQGRAASDDRRGRRRRDRQCVERGGVRGAPYQAVYARTRPRSPTSPSASPSTSPSMGSASMTSLPT